MSLHLIINNGPSNTSKTFPMKKQYVFMAVHPKETPGRLVKKQQGTYTQNHNNYTTNTVDKAPSMPNGYTSIVRTLLDKTRTVIVRCWIILIGKYTAHRIH